MSNLHIYTSRKQAATRYVVDALVNDEDVVLENPPRSLIRCKKCGRRRWAENCVVQVYYDEHVFWCAPGHGCKKRGKP